MDTKALVSISMSFQMGKIVKNEILENNQNELIFITSFSNSSRATTDLFLYFER